MTTLNDIPKQNPFKTPDGYFDAFSLKLRDKISESEQRAYSKSLLYRPIFYVISALVVAVFLGIFVVSNNSSTNVVNVTNTDVYVLLSENMYDIDEDILIDAYFDMQTGEAVEDIPDYILDEDIDIEDIY